ncbi:MAG: outer membrane beta-barrel protein [Bacteroidetes bacterium]|nr:outer membrane beta-barrel protein [Bacteroidota bacterium]
MKRLLVLAITSLGFVITCYPQNSIQGRITTQENIPLPFTNVVLASPKDSISIHYGTVTDMQGDFVFKNVNPQLHILIASAVGYETLYAKINSVDKDTVFQAFKMQAHTETLDEVTVTGNKVTHYADKTVYSISKIDKKSATSSFNLVATIPKLRVNTVENSISTMHNSAVKILINGQNADVRDLMTIKPEDVFRIEYYDIPPTRFAVSGVEAAINIITKKSIEGTNLLADLQNALFTGFGNDLFSFKYNRTNSQFNVLYYISYRKYKKRTVDNYLEYDFEDEHYFKNRVGLNSPFAYKNQQLRFEFVNQKKDNYALGIRLSPTIYSSNRSVFQDVFTSDQLMGESNATDQYYQVRPELNVYFSKQFENNQELLFDITTTYFNNEYSDERSEILSSGDTSFYNNLETISERYSLIAEGNYTKKLQRIVLTGGIRYSQSETNQEIVNTLENSKSASGVSFVYAFFEVAGGKNKLSYNLSAGSSYHTYKDKENLTSFNFLAVRPRISINYNINDNSALKFKFSVKPVIPTLAQLSPSRYYFDERLVFSGNPGLKPYNLHKTKLEYSFNKPHINISTAFNYSYANNPILFNYVEDAIYILKINSNQDYQKDYAISSNVVIYPFKSKWLKFSLYGELYKNVNVLKDLGTIDLFASLFDGDVTASYKNWTFNYSYYSGYKSLSSLDITKSAESSYVSINFKKDNFSTGIGMYYPFSDSWNSTRATVDKSLVNRKDTYNIYDNGQMLYLNLSYHISFGRKKNIRGKRIHNQDNDSGVLRSE